MRDSFVVGTAGHIDHGKSTLVKALTGTDPDRLAEEKARGMTIDLGFAWLTTPAGRSISIVDVPGHERFIKNMLAGVGGIDAAILVIAADEGPMPQTREHLAILDLLGVERGVVALTKADLVDADWAELVAVETAELLQGSGLADAPIQLVSATDDSGLTELISALDLQLSGLAAVPDTGRARLPIDRIFSIAGFGTVVTGTLLGGSISTGQELELLPVGKPARVRGLQSHAAKLDRALPGRRVAVNVANLEVDEIARGDILALPGLVRTSMRIDARLELLASSPVPLAQNAAVDLFTGAAELPARLTLLDRDQIAPGESGWVQFRFASPLAVLAGDRFIIRRPSPSATIGGGVVVDPNPLRHRCFQPAVIAALETLSSGGPNRIVLHALGDAPIERGTLVKQPPAGLDAMAIERAIADLISAGDVIDLDGKLLIGQPAWDALATQIARELTEFHHRNPFRLGIPREELKSRLRGRIPSKQFDTVLRAAGERGQVIDDGATVRLYDFTIVLDGPRQAAADRFVAAIAAEPFSPPGPSEFGLDPDTLGALVDLDRVVKITDGIYLHPKVYDRIAADVVELLAKDGTLTLARFRDHVQTSRKYAQAILEYLDQERITRRIGDERIRFTGPGAGSPKAGIR